MGMMYSNVIVYEDVEVEQFNPLVHLRPVFDLKVGMLSFIERIHLIYPNSRYHLFAREYLQGAITNNHPDFFVNSKNVGLSSLIFNGRTIIDRELIELIEKNNEQEFIVINNNEIAVAYLKDKNLKTFVDVGAKTGFESASLIKEFRKKLQIKIIVIEKNHVVKNIWSTIAINGLVLIEDFNLLNKKGIILSNLNSHIKVSNEEDVYIGKQVKVGPFVHIDATNGPVYISDNVEIKSNVIIEGPVFIDDDSVILPGYIRQNTTIGPNCRIGGEVEDTIFLGYTNKYHAGFVGHSYVGEWVNFGAMTTTSDLKNNYGDIKLQTNKDLVIDTGLMFLGSLIGDYVKFGIGTMLTTGSYIDFGSNLFGANEVMSKYVPPFSWGSSKDLEPYDFDKFLQTVEKTYERRNKIMLASDRELLGYLKTKLCKNMGIQKKFKYQKK